MSQDGTEVSSRSGRESRLSHYPDHQIQSLQRQHSASVAHHHHHQHHYNLVRSASVPFAMMQQQQQQFQQGVFFPSHNNNNAEGHYVPGSSALSSNSFDEMFGSGGNPHHHHQSYHHLQQHQQPQCAPSLSRAPSVMSMEHPDATATMVDMSQQQQGDYCHTTQPAPLAWHQPAPVNANFMGRGTPSSSLCGAGPQIMYGPPGRHAPYNANYRLLRPRLSLPPVAAPFVHSGYYVDM